MKHIRRFSSTYSKSIATDSRAEASNYQLKREVIRHRTWQERGSNSLNRDFSDTGSCSHAPATGTLGVGEVT
jgi:hypothetical protein